MGRTSLRETVVGTLDGSGNGTLKAGPLTAREMWHPDKAAVSANANPTNEAVCVVSVGDVNTRAFRDNTFTGSSGDSTDTIGSDTLRRGEFVWAQWTGGDAGQQMRLTVTGEKEI